MNLEQALEYVKQEDMAVPCNVEKHILVYFLQNLKSKNILWINNDEIEPVKDTLYIIANRGHIDNMFYIILTKDGIAISDYKHSIKEVEMLYLINKNFI